MPIMLSSSHITVVGPVPPHMRGRHLVEASLPDECIAHARTSRGIDSNAALQLPAALHHAAWPPGHRRLAGGRHDERLDERLSTGGVLIADVALLDSSPANQLQRRPCASRGAQLVSLCPLRSPPRCADRLDGM